jgi:hypothetical protein
MGHDIVPSKSLGCTPSVATKFARPIKPMKKIDASTLERPVLHLAQNANLMSLK